jgi:tetratricopeptide (TPR) repeat protein
MTSLDEAMARSERRARRLWLISLVWVFIMVAVAAMFARSIYKFDETSVDILKIREEITAQQRQAQQLISDLEKTKQTMSALERSMLEKLSVHDAELHVLHLQIFSIKDLTPAQKDFVKELARKQSGNQSMDERPSTDRVITLIVQAYSELLDGNYTRSYDTYTKALAADPQSATAYAGRATAAAESGEFLKAYMDYTEAIQLQKDESIRSMILPLRGDALISLGKIDEAQSDFVEAGRSQEPVVRGQALNGLGRVGVLRKDWQGAEKNFRDSAEIDPGRKAGVLENIGLIYLAQSDWGRAYSWNIEMSKMVDSSQILWGWVIQALAAEKLGKTQESTDLVKRFLQSSKNPKRNLSALEIYLGDDLGQLARKLIQQAEKS